MRQKRHRAHGALNRLARTGKVAVGSRCRRSLAAVAILVAGVLPCTGASAVADAADACSQIYGEMTKQASPPPSTNSDAARSGSSAGLSQNVFDYFYKRPSPVEAVLSTRWVASGDPITVTFRGALIEAVKDRTKICAKLFAERNPQKELPIAKATLLTPPAPQDQKQQFQVVFPAPPSENGDLAYTLVIGIWPDQSDKQPLIFAYSDSAKVTSKRTTALWAIAFALAAYMFLAWATYDKKDAERSIEAALDKPDAVPSLARKEVRTKVHRFVYVFSPVRITAGAFGDASLSQLQVILFTLIVAGLLFQLFLRTGVLSDISQQLLFLLGISAVGAGTAKFTATIKNDLSDQAARYLIGKGWYSWPVQPLSQHATFAKLMLTDGRLDVYKFQMAIFTVVVAIYVIRAGQADLSNVNISDTMLYLIGISQGVYVGGKAVTDRTTDLEAAVAKMIDLDAQIQDLSARIDAVPPPNNVDDLKTQRTQKCAEYRKAAKTAVDEYCPLTHRQFPQVSGKLDPAVLEPTGTPVSQPSPPPAPPPPSPPPPATASGATGNPAATPVASGASGQS